MLIPALLTQPLQRLLQLKKILHILATRPATANNMLRQRLRVLRAEELRVIRETDVHQTADLAW